MDDTLFIPLVGAIAVALIGGGISLALAILTKDQKTSEFRQAWIDALRDDVSKLVAHMSVVKSISNIVKEMREDEKQKFILSKQEHFIETGVVVTRIRLRLNRTKDKKLIDLVAKMEGLGKDPEAYDQRVEDIVVEAQSVLKTEWKRVKRGEWSFRLLKYFSLLVLLCGVWMSYTAWNQGLSGLMSLLSR